MPCGVTRIAFGASLYALASLWAFFLLYCNNVIKGVCKHSADRVWPETWSFSHVSGVHAETISGRGSLSHYWTALALGNCILGALLGAPLGGLEQLAFFLLPIFPLRSPVDKVCGFLPVRDEVCAFIHYCLVVAYLCLSLVVFVLGGSWRDAAVQSALSVTALALLAANSRFAIEFEALASTYISVYYLRSTVTMNVGGCFY